MHQCHLQQQHDEHTAIDCCPAKQEDGDIRKQNMGGIGMKHHEMERTLHDPQRRVAKLFAEVAGCKLRPVTAVIAGLKWQTKDRNQRLMMPIGMERQRTESYPAIIDKSENGMGRIGSKGEQYTDRKEGRHSKADWCMAETMQVLTMIMRDMALGKAAFTSDMKLGLVTGVPLGPIAARGICFQLCLDPVSATSSGLLQIAKATSDRRSKQTKPSSRYRTMQLCNAVTNAWFLCVLAPGDPCMMDTVLT